MRLSLDSPTTSVSTDDDDTLNGISVIISGYLDELRNLAGEPEIKIVGIISVTLGLIGVSALGVYGFIHLPFITDFLVSMLTHLGINTPAVTSVFLATSLTGAALLTAHHFFKAEPSSLPLSPAQTVGSYDSYYLAIKSCDS